MSELKYGDMVEYKHPVRPVGDVEWVMYVGPCRHPGGKGCIDLICINPMWGYDIDCKSAVMWRKVEQS